MHFNLTIELQARDGGVHSSLDEKHDLEKKKDI